MLLTFTASLSVSFISTINNQMHPEWLNLCQPCCTMYRKPIPISLRAWSWHLSEVSEGFMENWGLKLLVTHSFLVQKLYLPVSVLNFYWLLISRCWNTRHSLRHDSVTVFRYSLAIKNCTEYSRMFFRKD